MCALKNVASPTTLHTSKNFNSFFFSFTSPHCNYINNLKMSEHEHGHSHTHANGEVHHHAHSHDDVPDGSNVTVFSKTDKKARKAFEKAGLKLVPGIVRVTLRRGNNHIFVIAEPEVYRNPATSSYIVFGEAKLEDLSAALGAQAAAAAAAAGSAEEASTGLEDATAKVSLEDSAAADEEDVSEETLTKEGLSSDDLALIKDQTSASNKEILAALKENKGDIISTILTLTK